MWITASVQIQQTNVFRYPNCDWFSIYIFVIFPRWELMGALTTGALQFWFRTSCLQTDASHFHKVFFHSLYVSLVKRSTTLVAAVASEKKSVTHIKNCWPKIWLGMPEHAWRTQTVSDAMPAYCAVVSKVYFAFHRWIPSASLPPPPSTRMQTPCKRRRSLKEREERRPWTVAAAALVATEAMANQQL